MAAERGDVPFSLRPASAAERSTVISMVRSARLNPLGIHWRRFIVATDEAGAIIGCGQIKRHLDGSLELASLVVRRPWRRRGVARAIVESLIAQGHSRVWLTCAAPLVPFYEKLGFWEVTAAREMPWYFRIVSILSRLILPLFGSQFRLAVMVHTD